MQKLRILHISFARASGYKDPMQWLSRISFFTGVLSAMAQRSDVYSIHPIDFEGTHHAEGVRYILEKRNGTQRLFPSAILRAARRVNPHVVIVHGLIYPHFVLCLKALLPATRIFAQNHAERPLRGIRKFLQRKADGFIEGYFFCSRLQAHPWVRSGMIQSIEKVHEVMEVSSRFYPLNKRESRKELNLIDGTVYLWVGRLDKNKDPETLLKAFVPFARNNPSVVLYMIFQSEELLTEIKSVANMLPTQIKLVGKVPHEELLYWYNASDYIISTSHYEGSGIAVCEAMSCGCFPILTEIPSFIMMTGEGKTGILFKPGNPTDLQAVLEKTASVNREDERMRTLQHFKEYLSFQAISAKIYSVVSSKL